LKVPGILRSFIAAVHPRRRKIIASKSGGSKAGGDSKPTKQKAPRIPATFKNQQKSWTSLAFQLRNPQILQNPTANQCFSRKTLGSILEKFQSKLACFSEISAEKKTGFSWMTQRLIKIFRIVR
jgi:hypothetical protein